MIGTLKKVGTELFGWERKTRKGIAIQDRGWLAVALQTSLWRARWRESGCRRSRRESQGITGEQVAITE